MKSYCLKLDDDTFAQLNQIVKNSKTTMAEFIRNALDQKLKETKGSLSYRLTTLSYCDKKESDEILDSVKHLNDDELKIAKKETINL
ncbi:hypothetical protein [Campylobacter fetus]|uniref:hypothetical protein n=1 Tax=Campylobacter fetus TaxID=196 RepID=UPI00073AB5EA|nr:hypothetical protein [Campylobacter fetus]ALV64674.1 hypothetical protein CFTSP3_0705 [Campylobacter fetus subsp. testudinum Sp3]